MGNLENLINPYSYLDGMANVYLFNTMGRKKQKFVPLRKEEVGLYTCGPTVYNFAHIGNLRTYIFEDLLKRVLIYNGFKVKQVMNITDVGHLLLDPDSGKDRMEEGAKREGRDVWAIAEEYQQAFFQDCNKLNILKPEIICKATDHIKEQIALIQKLESKGFTYRTSDGIYFDSSKFPDYGKMALIDKKGLEAGKRIGLREKKNPTDFALWKFSPKDEKRQMEWESPWGKGFPGWHIECSAMSMKYLGETFDIHAGGIDHIPIHHTNEIAQSEAATGKKFVNFWLHGEFLILDNEKMSKSSGDFLTLDKLVKQCFEPLEYRYFCLGTHYRKPLTFSWDNLRGARNSFSSLKREVIKLAKELIDTKLWISAQEYDRLFLDAVNDDLNLPAALGHTWNMLRDPNINPSEKYASILKYDKIFGLNLRMLRDTKEDSPKEIVRLADQREIARRNKDWVLADTLRKEISKKGYAIDDTSKGYVIKSN